MHIQPFLLTLVALSLAAVQSAPVVDHSEPKAASAADAQAPVQPRASDFPAIGQFDASGVDRMFDETERGALAHFSVEVRLEIVAYDIMILQMFDHLDREETKEMD